MIAQQGLSSVELREFVSARELPARRLTCCSSVPSLPELILRYGAIVGSVIHRHGSVGRTMDLARRQIVACEQGGRSVASGTVILAETVSASKGRFARDWHAPVGGVWGCLILADTLMDRARTLLPLALGVACCEAVRECGAETATVRWVNDVMVGQRKLAGFLVESYRSPGHGELFHLLGFGINVNNDCFPESLADVACSLVQLLGRQVSLRDFTLSFLAKMAWNIGLLWYEDERDLQHLYDSQGPEEETLESEHLLLRQWQRLSDTIGKRVLYGYDIQKKPLYTATVMGIRKDGAIVMRQDDGAQIVEHGGELRYVEGNHCL